MTGKYSPTICNLSLGTFESRCDTPNSIYDREGFDMYGYNESNVDRAGKTEFDYLSADWSNEDFGDEYETLDELGGK